MMSITKQYNLDWLTDPEIFQINRLPAHSDHLFFSEDEELQLNLNGGWKFCYANNLHNTDWSFWQEGFCDEGWNDIEVPSHIQLQGYGIPQYTNTMYPWDGHEKLVPPQIPTEFNPVGSYVKYFHLPDNFINKKTVLRFEGVESAMYVWMNGKFVGYSEDTFTPSEFDVTEQVKPGENRLCVAVVRFCSGSWLEDQDFWRFSGIFRDVALYSLPEVHVTDIDARPCVSEDLSEGVLEADFLLDYEECDGAKIHISLLDADEISIDSFEALVEKKICFVRRFQNINLWSAEKPYLYKLEYKIISQSGAIIEQGRSNIGFRRFEIRDGIMYLNNKRIVFHGVNRHEFSHKSGRAISKEDMLTDVLLMKKNNINAVRTSHYPNQSYFYELCDQYGIYMIDEANLETHGTWMIMGEVNITENTVPNDNECWLGAVLDRGMSMVERDKNHPSILMWSVGNESAGGKVLYELAQYYRNRDKLRLVHYEGVFHDRSYDNTSDVESRMYAKPHEIIEYLENDAEKPFISCEYSHAMGNSIGGIKKYIDIEDSYPMYQGGFIWDFIDQALEHRDPNGQIYLATGGDFGDRPNDGYFCGDGLLYADRRVSSKMQEVKFVYQNLQIHCDSKGALIKNKFLFTNTNEFMLNYRLLKDGKEIRRGSMSVDIPPLSEHYVPLPIETDDNGEYILDVSFVLKKNLPWANKGHEISFGQGVISRPTLKIEESPVQIIDGDVNLAVKMQKVRAMFWKVDKTLKSLNVDGKELLKAPIKPDFWRAPIDNDAGNHSTFDWAIWKGISLYTMGSRLTLEDKDKSITAEYAFPIMKGKGCTMHYQFLGSDICKITMRMDALKEIATLPQFGFTFSLLSEFNRVRYYGRGPMESYVDRKAGGRIGIYNHRVEEMMEPYLNPQETGNRTDVRWIEIMNDDGTGIKIFSETPFEASVLPFTSHEIENAGHINELPPVTKTVVNISMAKSGVGGDDSWGAPIHSEYLVKCDNKLEFDVYIQGLKY